MFQHLIRRLKTTLSLDLRSLGLLRIGVGMVLIIDLIIRAGDLSAHYTDKGVLPLSLLFSNAWNTYHFSIYTISGLRGIMLFLFSLNFLTAFMLMIGYRTRIFSIVCWLFLLSLHNRNPMVLQAGDDYLRLLLFWGIFLPWGKRYAIDSKNTFEEISRKNQYFSPAAIAYIIQICSVYVFTALYKDNPEWNLDGTATYYALSLDQMVFPFGKWLYPHKEFLRFITLSTYYLEMFGPVLLLIPLRSWIFRCIFIIIMTDFHLGITLSLNVGLFSLISIVALLGLLPAEVMDWAERKLKKNLKESESNNWDKKTELLWEGGAQPSTNSGLSASYAESPADKTGADLQSARSQSSANITPNSQTGSSIRRIFRATKTKRFGNILFNTLIIFLIIYCLVWNWGTLPRSKYALDERSNWLGFLLRIDQNWGMFAPTVFKDDGWFIFQGKTKDGKLIDIHTGGKMINTAKPAYIAGMHKNDRWRKYTENVLFINNSWMRPYYCDWLTREWNYAHPEKKVSNLHIIYMKEVTLPDYKYSKPKADTLQVCE